MKYWSKRYRIYGTWESRNNGFRLEHTYHKYDIRNVQKVIKIINSLPFTRVSVKATFYGRLWSELPETVEINLYEREIADIKTRGENEFLATLEGMGKDNV